MTDRKTTFNLLEAHVLGDTRLELMEDTGGGAVEVRLIPATRLSHCQQPRDALELYAPFTSIADKYANAARLAESAVHLHLAEDERPIAFTNGATLCASPSTGDLQFISASRDGDCIQLEFTHPRGLRLRVFWQGLPSGCGFKVWTSLTHEGDEPVTLELLSSFCLGGITPFAADNAPGRLHAHRFLSSWSSEGRHVTSRVEDLGLEPSWTGFNLISERFGQLGSMPCRGYMPTVALEDREAGVFWGARLAWPASWQMEILRARDNVSLTGGLPDFEFGHWQKTILPGTTFTTPHAFVTTVHGDLDALCQRLNQLQEDEAYGDPPGEATLPIQFNDWCTHSGHHDQGKLLALAEALQGKDIAFFIVDAGWSKKNPAYENQASNGDWLVHEEKFPDGMSAYTQAIRDRGMTPGIWFEFEVCTEGSDAYRQTEHLLKRGGKVITTGTRRFWDFRDPWVVDYLSERVIAFLRTHNFGYMKVDYNDTIGLGCDGAESLGEGLRQHIAGVMAFFRKIRAALPDLVLENCSSGGHRLDPFFSTVSSVTSFSDAHQTLDMPIVAASVQRQIAAKRSLIWAVLHPRESIERLQYSLAITFMGRMCLSGNLTGLSAAQWQVVDHAIALYRSVAPLITSYQSHYHHDYTVGWRTPRGWQALVRYGADGQEALVVYHHFLAADVPPAEIALPAGKAWQVAGHLAAEGYTLDGDVLHFASAKPLTGNVIHLKAGHAG